MPFEKYISQEQIKERVSQLGKAITSDYQGKNLVVVGVLNGSFMFLADLVREIKGDVNLDFISVSSYKGTQSTGVVELIKDIKIDVENKDVLLVEDIVDTGLTIKELVQLFKKRNPSSVKLASLLHKSSKTVHPVEIDYLGFEIDDKFVIGYGLDFDGKYRELPYIGIYSDK